MNAFKVIIKRFLKGFFAGALSSAAVVTFTSVGTWRDLGSALSAFALMAVIGGLTGGILALEKAYNYTPEPPTND